MLLVLFSPPQVQLESPVEKNMELQLNILKKKLEAIGVETEMCEPGQYNHLLCPEVCLLPFFKVECFLNIRSFSCRTCQLWCLDALESFAVLLDLCLSPNSCFTRDKKNVSLLLIMFQVWSCVQISFFGIELEVCHTVIIWRGNFYFWVEGVDYSIKNDNPRKSESIRVFHTNAFNLFDSSLHFALG